MHQFWSLLLTRFTWLCMIIAGAASANTATNPQVMLETSMGNIQVELYMDKAPLSAGDFLAYVQQGLFDNQLGFHRVVRPDNDHGTPVISVIQAGLKDGAQRRTPIAHETTKQTGLKHLDGTLSIARAEPGTGGGSDFFICVGDQPALDYGAKRNPDGQGFAAFGRVVSGMDVVRKINALQGVSTGQDDYVDGQILAEPISITKADLLPQ
ncbi:peptidylprolyl isomerase [Bowmanella pacifica]|uniref:peptidylprolyl isomerase n=1 Tax=Bowmanella pacifica TaxID=502051 RepID=A0A917YSC0_9ALTE|nr:peptidylprolyl isomerase [Bowmanella pacifica]GGO65133.1 peptidyl-prolyl cis-trans isomerase [Bowmanella pacifica]